MYRAAMRSIVSQLLRDERIVVVDQFNLSAPKTKELAGMLTALDLSRVLIVTDTVDESLYLASRNLPGVSVLDADGVDPVSLLQFEKILMTAGAVRRLDEVLA
jgi:large subunit ribosomal protein L4